MTVIGLGLLLLAVSALVGLAGWCARVRASQLVNIRKGQELFYERAHRLVEDSRTPEEIVHLLGFLSARIDSLATPWSLFPMLAVAKAKGLNHLATRFDEAEQRLSKEGRESLADATLGFVIAAAFKSMLLGWAFRRLLRRVGSPDARGGDAQEDGTPDREAALSVAEYFHNRRIKTA